MALGGQADLEAVLTLRDQFSKRLGAAGGRVQNFRKRLQGMRTQLLLVSGALIGIGVASTKAFLEFDKAMVRIVTLVGVARERVDGWREDVLALSGETARAPAELAEALFVVTSAGIRGAEAMDVLAAAAKASAVGMGETKDIARVVTSAVQAYQKSGLTAAQATDILTGTVREGNLAADELAGSLGRVLGIAAETGVTFNEVGAFIATFTRLGVSAEEATTSLRSVMTTFLNPTTEAEEAVAKLGLSMKELREQIRDRGLTETLIGLVKQFKGNESALVDIIPNVRALSGVLGTAGSQAESFRQVTENMNSVLGITDEAFATVAESSAFQFEQAMVDLKVAMVEMGAEIAPVFQTLLGVIRPVIRMFGDLSDLSQRFIIALGGMTAAVALLGVAFAIAGGPVTLIAAGIVLAIAAWSAAIILLIENWETVEAVIRRVINNVIGIIEGYVNVWIFSVNLIIKGINKLAGVFGQKIPEISNLHLPRWEKAQKEVTEAVEETGEAVEEMGDTAVEAFEETTGAVEETAVAVRGVTQAFVDLSDHLAKEHQAANTRRAEINKYVIDNQEKERLAGLRSRERLKDALAQDFGNLSDHLAKTSALNRTTNAELDQLRLDGFEERRLMRFRESEERKRAAAEEILLTEDTGRANERWELAALQRSKARRDANTRDRQRGLLDELEQTYAAMQIGGGRSFAGSISSARELTANFAEAFAIEQQRLVLSGSRDAADQTLFEYLAAEGRAGRGILRNAAGEEVNLFPGLTGASVPMLPGVTTGVRTASGTVINISIHAQDALSVGDTVRAIVSDYIDQEGIGAATPAWI